MILKFSNERPNFYKKSTKPMRSLLSHSTTAQVPIYLIHLQWPEDKAHEEREGDNEYET